MKIITALKLEPEDFQNQDGVKKAALAMARAELVIYRDHIVKNRNGKITRNLTAMLAQEQRTKQGVY